MAAPPRRGPSPQRQVPLVILPEASHKDKISVHDVSFVIAQIVRIAHECMDEATARTFEALIKEKIRVGVSGEGTMSTPDTDVQEMDSSVPLAQ